jgi:N utilization substance protein A
MVAVREQEFGPLPDDLIGMSVDVDIVGEVLEVYYNRALRARFNATTGEQLPLDD